MKNRLPRSTAVISKLKIKSVKFLASNHVNSSFFIKILIHINMTTNNELVCIAQSAVVGYLVFSQCIYEWESKWNKDLNFVDKEDLITFDNFWIIHNIISGIQ